MCDSVRMENRPTAAELERIAAQQDMVLRNLRITDAYHRLALAVRDCTGAGANWCTFATWASKQAGHTIRREDLLDFLRARLRSSAELTPLLHAVLPLTVLHSVDHLIAAIADAINDDPAFAQAAQSVGEGNLKVFQEIAIQFRTSSPRRRRARPAPSSSSSARSHPAILRRVRGCWRTRSRPTTVRWARPTRSPARNGSSTQMS